MTDNFATLVQAQADKIAEMAKRGMAHDREDVRAAAAQVQDALPAAVAGLIAKEDERWAGGHGNTALWRDMDANVILGELQAQCKRAAL